MATSSSGGIPSDAPRTQHNRGQRAVRKSKTKPVDSKREALLAKQATRKFRGASVPDPSLGITFDEFTSFTNFLRSSKRVFALLGAGLSASSGLATFRGSDRFWRGIEPSTLSDAQAFYNDPVQVWWLFSHRMMKAQNARPNAAHVALTKLAQSNDGFFAVNQNIDGLCERAGFPPAQIAQLHGTLFSVKCSKYQSTKDECDYTADASYPISGALTLPTTVDLSDASVPLPEITRENLPHCPRCNHLLRPNVVFFGEPANMITTEEIYNFTNGGHVDLMLVIGTSTTIMSSAMYIPVARNAGARVAFFNLEESDEEPGRLSPGDWFFRGDAAVMVPEMLKSVVGNIR